MIDFLPMWVSLVTIAVGMVGVVIIVYKTPDGQSPVEWFPAFLDRKLKPDEYQMKPKDHTKYGAPEVNYLNVVHTAPLIEQEEKEPLDTVEMGELIDSINHAEKLETSEMVQSESETEDSSEPTGLFQKVKP